MGVLGEWQFRRDVSLVIRDLRLRPRFLWWRRRRPAWLAQLRGGDEDMVCVGLARDVPSFWILILLAVVNANIWYLPFVSDIIRAVTPLYATVMNLAILQLFHQYFNGPQSKLGGVRARQPTWSTSSISRWL